jgi:hypothetical protein
VRRGLIWLLVAPLVVLGSQAAHALDYWFAAPHEHDRAELLAETGHGYLEQAPAAIALCLGLIVLALAGRFLRARGPGRPGGGLSLAPFAVLPLVAFALQEHLERLLHEGTFPAALLLDPIFLLGLALQLPFGYLGYLVGRALLGAADRLARSLGGRPAPGLALPPLLPAAVSADVPRLSPLATRLASRGPPSRD